MSEKEIIEEFKNLTGASETTAKSYLNSTKFNLESAVHKYFDHQEQQKQQPKKPKEKVNTFQTFGDSDDEKDDTKRDYVGSGLNVIGSKKDDIYSQIIKKAQQQQNVPEEKKEEKKEKPEDKWKGGKKLGDTSIDVKGEKKEEKVEEKVEFQEKNMSEEEQLAQIMKMINQQRGENKPKLEKEKTAVLTLYKNGFCINDGAFMSFDVPENKKMMEEINSGHVPRPIQEMIGPAISYAFQLDAREGNYVPSIEKFKAFTSGGRTLGAKVEEKKEEKKEEKFEKIEFDLKIDDSKPTTTVQVRMPDGTSLKVKLNLDHQVSDLKKFIQSSDPKLKSFSVSTTYPRKELTNDSETIEKAGLKNSTVLVNQK